MTLRHIAMLAVALCLTGPLFAAGEAEQANGAETRTVVDALGREVTIPADFNRVVALPIPIPSVFFTIDGTGERIVGMHPSSYAAVEGSILGRIAPALLEAETDFVTQGFQVNTEELLALEPDIVFQWASQTEEIEKMEAVGLPVIAVPGGGQDFRNAREWLRLVGEVTGKSERLQDLLDFHRETEAMVEERLADVPESERPRAMVLHHPPLQARAYAWLEAGGARNVAQGMPSWISEINIEQLYEWDPEIMYITNFTDIQPEDLYNNRVEGFDFSVVTAVQERQVHKIPMGAYRWDPPSQESPLMLLWLATKHFPERFSDIDVEGEIRSFYSTFYGYSPSQEEIDAILSSPGTERWRGWE
jgi:iron complex transport system substrate-binding protein